MKLNGIVGKGSGKLGSSVFAVSGGEQIVRQYNPKVANPNTTAQVEQRAGFKLASQLAAAMGTVVVIPKQGLKSSRNLFIKKNFPFISSDEEGATCEYEKLQLTAGNVGISDVVASRNGDNPISIALSASAIGVATRVCYCVFVKNAEAQLQLVTSKVVSEAGENGTFPTTIPAVNGELVIYAYGMKDKDAAATARYGNYQVEGGQDIARLVTSHSLSVADYTFTATKGITLASDTPWVNPYPDASLKLNDISATIENGQASVDSDLTKIEIFGLGSGNSVSGVSENWEFPLSWDADSQMYWNEAADIPLPTSIFINGSRWITIVRE